MPSFQNSLLWLVPVLLVSAAPVSVADHATVYHPVPPGLHPGGVQPWAHPGGLHGWYLRYHDVPDWFERRDTVTLQAGDAVAANKAMQMRDPWPPYVDNRHILFHGEVAAGTMERYKAGPQAEPPPEYGNEYGEWTLSPREAVR